MKHSTYILYSKSRDKYYIGYTSSLESRVQKHNLGGTASTRTGKPWNLVYSEEFETKTEALKREKYIKRMKSRTYIERLIKNSSDG